MGLDEHGHSVGGGFGTARCGQLSQSLGAWVLVGQRGPGEEQTLTGAEEGRQKTFAFYGENRLCLERE